MFRRLTEAACTITIWESIKYLVDCSDLGDRVENCAVKILGQSACMCTVAGVALLTFGGISVVKLRRNESFSISMSNSVYIALCLASGVTACCVGLASSCLRRGRVRRLYKLTEDERNARQRLDKAIADATSSATIEVVGSRGSVNPELGRTRQQQIEAVLGENERIVRRAESLVV